MVVWSDVDDLSKEESNDEFNICFMVKKMKNGIYWYYIGCYEWDGRIIK